MSDFVKEHNLEKKAGNEGKLGIYDGQDFVFVESNYTLLTLTKLVMRYGFDVLRMKRWVGGFLNSFEKVKGRVVACYVDVPIPVGNNCVMYW